MFQTFIQNWKLEIGNSRRGSVLLLAMLILASVFAASVAMGTIVTREIRSNRQLDDAVVAYYAAESILEQGLWREAQGTPLAELQTTDQRLLTGDETTSLVSRTVTNKGERIEIPFIARGMTAAVDLYNPNAGAGDLAAAMQTLTLRKHGGILRITCEERTREGAVPCPAMTADEDVNTYTMDPTKAYRLVFMAEGADVRGIMLSGLTNDGSAVLLPTPLTIAATGTFTTSRQALKVSLPTDSPFDTLSASDGTNGTGDTGGVGGAGGTGTTSDGGGTAGGSDTTTGTGDGGATGNTDTSQTCTPTTPTLTKPSVAERSAEEDSAYTYNVESSVEGRSGTRYELVTKPPVTTAATFPGSVMRMDAVTGIITWIPVNDQVGAHTVEYNVIESCGGSATQTFTIVAQNDTPIITSVAPLSTKVGDQYSYNVENDNDEGVGGTQYRLTAKPDGMTIDAVTGAINWTPRFVDSGKVRSVVVEVDDQNGGIATQSFSIFVRSSFDPSTLTLTKYNTGFEASTTSDIEWYANTIEGRESIVRWEGRKLMSPWKDNPDFIAAIDDSIASIKKTGWMIGTVRERSAAIQGTTTTLTDGVVLYTEDGGKTWTRKSTLAKTVTDSTAPAWWYSTLPSAVTFFDRTNGVMGFASPDSNTIKWTNSAGATWNDATGGSFGDIRQFSFAYDPETGDTIGFAVGATGIAKTVDQGKTWSTVRPYGANVRLQSVHLRDVANAWAVGKKDVGGGVYRGIIVKTTNGGATWAEEERTDMTDMKSVTFAHDQWWIAGGGVNGGARLIALTDMGTLTTALTGGSPSFQWLNSVSFASVGDSGWVSGGVQQGVGSGTAVIFTTTNGGQTWQLQESTVEETTDITRVIALGDRDAVAVASAYFLATNDSGTHWIMRGNERAMTIRQVVPVTDTFLLATGRDGESPLGKRILASTDGGKSWERRRLTITSGERPDVVDAIFFLDTQNGWARGWKATGSNITKIVFLKTKDGGATWATESFVPTTPLLASVYDGWPKDLLFTSPTSGFATGDARGIYLYSVIDGVATWRYAAVSQEDSRPVAFASRVGTNEMYLLTYMGEQKVYARGTTTWDPLTQQPNFSYTDALYIAPSGKRTVAGLQISSVKSGIGGAPNADAPWQVQTMEGQTQVALTTDFEFFDEEKAIAVGQNSSLFVTTDGTTWKRPTLLPSGFTLPTNLLLTSIAFKGGGGFIGTNAGFIYAVRPRRTDTLSDFSLSITPGPITINEGDRPRLADTGTLPQEQITHYWVFDRAVKGAVSENNYDTKVITLGGAASSALHRSAQLGTYTVEVLAVTESGQRGFATTTVTVNDVPPIAAAGRDITVSVGDVVPLNGGGSYAGDYDDISFYWDVDPANGLSFDPEPANADLTGAAPRTLPNGLRYLNPGVHTITLEVRDDDNSSARDTVTVTVVDILPQAIMKYTVAPRYTNQQYVNRQFSLHARDSKGGIISYAWDIDERDGIDFADPDAVGEEIPITYTTSGIYTVHLRVTDYKDRVSDATLQIFVNDFGMSISDGNVRSGLQAFIHLEQLASREDFTYYWIFGDGTLQGIPTEAIYDQTTSRFVGPSDYTNLGTWHTFTRKGTFTVSAFVKSASGKKAWASSTQITIQ